MSIVTRSTSGYNVVAKGSGLTNTEADNNIYELLSDPSYPGVDMAALHRSPNAVTAMFVYDTSKDSDGGAWTEKCQHTSWYNEPLMGKWLGACPSESGARFTGATLGSELVTNGTFDTSISGWTTSNGATVAWVNGKLRVTSTNGGTQNAMQTISVVGGKTYRIGIGSLVAYDASGNVDSSRRARIEIAVAYGSITTVATTSGLSNRIEALNGGDSGYIVFVPSASTTLYIYADTASNAAWAPTGYYGEFDNISVREVTATSTTSGDYFQLTTDGKFYRLWKNLLKYSTQLNNTSSQRNYGTVTQNASISPNGTNDAFLFTGTGGTCGWDNYPSDYGSSGGMTQTFSIYAKANTTGLVTIKVQANSYVNFNVSTGTIVSSAGDSVGTITSLSNGWYRLSVTAQKNNQYWFWGVFLENSANTTNSMYLWGPQLEYGSTVTSYEAKTSDISISEVFRGNKAKFPKVAGIVAEAANVTIYDLTEPGRPMWMRFAGAYTTASNAFYGTNIAISGVVCGQGKLLIAGGSGSAQLGIGTIDLTRDSVRWVNASAARLFKGFIAQRQQALDFDTSGTDRIVNSAANAVAMTVLPDAPVDPVTGLKVPTIAVATAGGVSVIKHDGVVVNDTTNHTGAVAAPQAGFTKDGRLYRRWDQYRFGVYKSADKIPQASFATTNNYDLFHSSAANSVAVAPFLKGDSSSQVCTNVLGNSDSLIMSAIGVVNKLKRSASDRTRTAISTITNTYNTGHMIGDIRRAYLADNTVESVSAKPERVTNGGFDDATGWTLGDATVSVAGGKLVFNNTPHAVSATGTGATTAPTVGMRLVVNINISSYTTGAVRVIYGGVVIADYSAAGSFRKVFTATSASNSPGLQAIGTTAAEVESLSIREAAESDRSYKAAGATITGTLTKSQVASNTSLVAYSGFSAANYLQEPYSADLDFGTGEWSVGAWVNTLNTAPPNVNVCTAPLIGVISGWTQPPSSGSVTVTTNAVAAPDTTITATRIVVAGASASTYYLDSTRFPAGMPITVSFDARGVNGGEKIAFGTNAAYPTQTLTNQWATYSVSISATNNNGVLFIGLGSYVGQTDAEIHIANIMVAQSATPQPFVNATYTGISRIADRAYSSGPTIYVGVDRVGKLTATAYDGTTTRTVTTSAAYNTATWCKAEAVYKTDGSLAILVNGNEVAVTRGNPLLSLTTGRNLLAYSQGFDNSVWNKLDGKSYVTGGFTAPDGTSTAFKFCTARTLSEQKIIRNTMSSSGLKTFSIYAKAAELNYLWIDFTDNGTCIFNITAGSGAVVSGSGASIVDAGNGWYRCIVALTKTDTFIDLQLYNGSSEFFAANVGDGAYIWGAQLDQAGAATDYFPTNVAPLTIGNSYALDAPFPGSIALLKLSATAPTYDQALWMYEQEKHLFRDGAQCVLPDANSIVDLTYDSQTDRWKAISSTNESYWSGLVRTKVEPVPAGSYTKLAANSGIHLAARSTTNPGVDITIPKINIKEEYKRKAESAQKTQKNLVVFDFDTISFTATTTNGSKVLTSVASVTGTPYRDMGLSGTGVAVGTTLVGTDSTTYYISAAATASNTGVTMTQTDYTLPVGYTASLVFLGGVQKIEGATKDFIRLFDGFRETIRFNAAPSSGSWIQIHAYVDQS